MEPKGRLDMIGRVIRATPLFAALASCEAKAAANERWLAVDRSVPDRSGLEIAGRARRGDENAGLGDFVMQRQ